MAKTVRGIKRFSLDDPDDLAFLLRSGGIWKFTQYWQIAIDAIKDGLVPLSECKNVPPEVMEGFSK